MTGTGVVGDIDGFAFDHVARDSTSSCYAICSVTFRWKRPAYICVLLQSSLKEWMSLVIIGDGKERRYHCHYFPKPLSLSTVN